MLMNESNEVHADPELLTIEQLADLIHASRSSIYNMRYRGEGPPSYRLGGRVLFKRGDVLAWVEEHLESVRAS